MAGRKGSFQLLSRIRTLELVTVLRREFVGVERPRAAVFAGPLRRRRMAAESDTKGDLSALQYVRADVFLRWVSDVHAKSVPEL